MAFLDEILKHKPDEIDSAKAKHSIGDLKRMAKDTPPLRPFLKALSYDFGLIAEIKKKSPSAGLMRAENVNDAPAAYNESRIVRAVSVLTDTRNFGMSVDDLMEVKSKVHQPILRKDFILGEYQIHEARAYGADAVLLMANVLNTREKMRRVYDVTCELGLEALFEARTETEIDLIPENAKIYGVNSREFMAVNRWRVAKFTTKFKVFSHFRHLKSDPTVNLQAFRIISRLPKQAIKVAESGVSPSKVNYVKELGYNAVLVGTSLLQAPSGIRHILREFEKAIPAPCESAQPDFSLAHA